MRVDQLQIFLTCVQYFYRFRIEQVVFERLPFLNQQRVDEKNIAIRGDLIESRNWIKRICSDELSV